MEDDVLALANTPASNLHEVVRVRAKRNKRRRFAKTTSNLPRTLEVLDVRED